MLGKLGDLESWVDDLLQPGCGLTNQMLGSGESGEFQFLERTIWLNSSGIECEEKSPAPNHMHFQAEKRLFSKIKDSVSEKEVGFRNVSTLSVKQSGFNTGEPYERKPLKSTLAKAYKELVEQHTLIFSTTFVFICFQLHDAPRIFGALPCPHCIFAFCEIGAPGWMQTNLGCAEKHIIVATHHLQILIHSTKTGCWSFALLK